MMQDLTGAVFKGYELRACIGSGGSGVVYRAFQAAVGREVALKIISPLYASQPEFIQSFETEAGLIAALEHPCITPLYDYWRDPTGAYLVTRLLRGGSLRDKLRNGAQTLSALVALLDQIAAALHVAHRNGVIHGDLKPDNILFDEDDNAYLADFGIATMMHPPGMQPSPDAGTGVPAYLAPEQVRGEPSTPLTDIYTLGIVIYEALTGQHPFAGVSPVEQLYKHLNAPFPPANYPDAVNEVLQKASARNPTQRYPDVLALVAAFREAAGFPRSQTLSALETLTFREQEVLQLIVNGRNNRQIADKLVITTGTVKWYIKQIYRKLGVGNRVQAIVRARDLPLITPNALEKKPHDSPGLVTEPEPQNPYKGLRAFRSADNRDFFGRESLVKLLVERPGEIKTGDSISAVLAASKFNRFLAVVGPSGSGKSSLVKAGLIPALWRGDVPGSERWLIAEMLPGLRIRVTCASKTSELDLAEATVTPVRETGVTERSV